MLHDDDKDQIRACLDALKLGLPGFRTRRPQLEMIATVAQALGQCREADPENVHGSDPDADDMAEDMASESAGKTCRDDPAPGAHIAVIEAGTGTGKTLGYLVPALVLARRRRKHLVVSSSTVALQEQLSFKDAPALQQVLNGLGLGFTFAVAKGRARYACAAKLMEAALQAQQRDLDEGIGNAYDDPASGAAASDDDGRLDDPVAEDADAGVGTGVGTGASTSDEAPDARGVSGGSAAELTRKMQIVRHLAMEFEAQRWSGERDELQRSVPDAVWLELVTDRQGCTGSRCPSFARCPFYLARQKVRDADLVIANHDLVLASLEMEAGSVLPDPAETFYVFDEAHTLSAKIVEHLAARHTLKGAVEWVEGLGEAVRDVVLGLKLDAAFLRDARQNTQTLSETLVALHAHLHSTRAFADKRARRFKDNRLPDWAQSVGARLLTAAQELRQTTLALREQMLERAPAEPYLVQQLLASLGFFASKLDKLIDTWVLMLTDDENGRDPIARWVERYDGAADAPTPGATSQPHDYLICASPLTGGDRLRGLLWRRVSAAVVTSATLTSCGRFDLFLDQSGLKPLRGLRLLQVASPFDYANRAQLVIPAMACDPKQADAHTAEVATMLPDLVSTAGTLVLFASAKQMRQVHALQPESLRGCILMQGTLPKMEMLARHRAAIDSGQRSVLFGLTSLAEGVDLPGDYCTHVVCAKLPFTKPDNPLEEARREHIESLGRSAFLEVTVPETGVRLQQMAGRLMRTDQDHGRVTVLDRRLITRPWGRRLLQGLPPFKLVIEGR